MKFIDQLYELYKNQLTGDEEDVLLIISGILSELNRDELLALMNDMTYEEIYQMIGSFMVEKLRVKLIENGAGVPSEPLPDDRIH